VEVEQSQNNLLDGQWLAEKIAASGGTIDNIAKTIVYSGSVANSVGIILDKFNYGKYTIIAKFTNTNSNPNLNIRVYYSDNSELLLSVTNATEIATNTYKFTTATNKQISAIGCSWIAGTTTLYYDIFGIYEGDINSFELYHGSTTNYEFGVLGKNKFNWDVPVSESSPVGSDAATARKFTLDTYVIGMSVNNYYRQNYANWVLNPSVENGVISFSSGGASGYGIAFPLKLAAGQTYYLSGIGNGAVGATYYDAEGNLISYQNGRLNKTITVPNDTAITLIGFYASTSNTDYEFSNIQLELGSSATAYEPYNPNKTVYGGWVDLISGEVCEEYGLFVPDENSYITVISGNTYKQFRFQTAPAILNRNNGFCTHFTMTANPNVYGKTGMDWLNLACQLILQEDSSIYMTTVDELKSWLVTQRESGTPFQIVYQAATPNTYQLAPSSMQTFLSHNNVWSNADYVEVEYDLHETQSILARKQFIIANQPHVEKLAAAPLQSFETDMAAPLKECKVEFKPIQDLHGYDKPWVGGSGKNLFNINAVEQDPDNTTLSNSSARKFTTGTYAKGASYSNYWQASQIIECTINNNAITVSATTGYGVGFPIKMKEGTTYFISCAMTGNSSGQINIAPYDAEGNYLGDAVLVNYVNKTYTAPADIDIGVIIFRNQTSKDNPISTTFSNIQVEVGTAATDYEPWENICPISGWNNTTINKSGKNLIRENAEWYSFKCRPSNNILIGSSYNTIVVPVPTGTIRIHQGHVAGGYINYVCLADKLPEEGDTVYEGASKSGWTNYTVDNSAGHPYLLIHGPTGNPTVTPSEWSRTNENYVLLGEYEGSGYNPVQGISIPITFPSEAGTVYGGYVDLVTGEVWETYYQFVVDDTLTPQVGGTSYNGTEATNRFFWLPRQTSHISPTVNVDADLFCDKAINYKRGTWSDPNSRKGEFCINAYTQLHVVFTNDVAGITEEDDQAARSSKIKAWLSDNPMTFVLPLRVPTLVATLTPTQLTTLRGTNNIWANTNGPVEIKYWTH